MPTPKSNIELQFRVEVADRLARIEQKTESLQRTIQDKHEVLIAKLEPVLKLEEKVTAHDRQIQFWRGANSILGMLWVGALALLGKIKHIW